MNLLHHKRRMALLCIDSAILLAVYAFCAVLLTVANDSFEFLKLLLNFLIFAAFILVGRLVFKVYSNVWRYANSKAYLDIVISDAVSGAAALVVCMLIKSVHIGAWSSIAFVTMANCMTLVSRFVYQQQYKSENLKSVIKGEKINVAIVGAGQIGSLLAEELLYNKNSHYNPVCFFDLDKEKIGSRVDGLLVYPERQNLSEIVSMLHIREFFIAVPRLNGEEIKELHDAYSKTGCKVKVYEAAFTEDVTHGKHAIRELKIEDMLMRGVKRVDDEATRAHYEDKVVLVTGGGGSIGSELCRGIAKCKPRHLIIFDIYENNAYDIEQELRRKYGSELNLTVEIGSVRERARLEAVFAHYRPNIVLHAAAHKHVPLMEHSNAEAIKNNVFGTYNTADMAEKYGADKFILISTDKAVNPTNVMGASKRLCEMVVLSRSGSKTVFGAVRFGNVLGSNGSVIPLFRRQIAAGGPVTVTDKRIIRYFMTIPEAAGLVMQAGAMAKCGELFVLDMGKPVKIIDLAENMVKVSGYTPYVDIDIIETGLRPGEKLYEELLIKTEKLTKTDNDMIFIEEQVPPTREEVEEKLLVLREAVKAAEGEISSPSITAAMKSVVPTFYSPEEVNEHAREAEEVKLVMA